MSPPPIRFARCDSGRIAWAASGRGPLLLCAAWWVSHLERDWTDGRFRRFFEALGEHYTVVRYDRLGVGLSDRGRDRFDLDSELEQLTAVHRAAGGSPATVLGMSCGAPASLAYAHRHPDAVERLILFGAYGEGPSLGKPEVRDALCGLVRASWGLGSETIAGMFGPDQTRAQVGELSRTHRASASPDVAARLLQMTYELRVGDWVGRIRTPTTILHRTDDRTVGSQHGRALAQRIEGSELILLPGRAHVPWLGDADAVLEAILGKPAPPATGPRFQRVGEVWELGWNGQTGHVKHAKGLSDLATLLARPGVPVAARILAGHLEGPRAETPALDEQALRAYRDRLADLDREIDEAQARADLGAVQRLRAEEDALLEQLRSTAALGGRTRTLAAADERARKAVGGRIKTSLDRIETVLPELAVHLRSTVRTGSSCTYAPDDPPAWKL